MGISALKEKRMQMIINPVFIGGNVIFVWSNKNEKKLSINDLTTVY